jgi:hypothetical protein
MNNNNVDVDTMIINGNDKPHFSWTPEHEAILIEWADKAMCNRWLHAKSNALYSYLNAWYTIPVIVISTVTGTANFAQERVPVDYQNYFAMIVGGFNILAGIITTIQQFLKITQLNEAHRVSAIAWDKFYRNIKIELAKHPDERMEVGQMLKMNKEEYDRLMETSPSIPEKIIESFKKSFRYSDEVKNIAKPEICDVLIATEKFRNKWNSDDNVIKNIKQNELKQKFKENIMKSEEEKHILLVQNFKQTFFDINNRFPIDSEIIDNLKEKLNIEILQKIINDIRGSISIDDFYNDYEQEQHNIV